MIPDYTQSNFARISGPQTASVFTQAVHNAGYSMTGM